MTMWSLLERTSLVSSDLCTGGHVVPQDAVARHRAAAIVLAVEAHFF